MKIDDFEGSQRSLALIEVTKQFLTVLMSVGLSSRGESGYHVKLMPASAQSLFKDYQGNGFREAFLRGYQARKEHV